MFISDKLESPSWNRQFDAANLIAICLPNFKRAHCLRIASSNSLSPKQTLAADDVRSLVLTDHSLIACAAGEFSFVLDICLFTVIVPVV